VPVIRRKLASVQVRYGKVAFERRHYALLALMSIYGIELLADNAQECRAHLLATFDGYLGVGAGTDWHRAADAVLEANVIEADALTMKNRDGQPITFAEWGYLGKGKFQRRDFRLQDLAMSSTFSAEGSLFAHLGRHEIFTPTRTYAPITVSELANAALGSASIETT